jgi:pyridine nucleotide-disulfide oxidoreductase family protein
MQRLILAGGGHAHLSVLQALARARAENIAKKIARNVDLVLVTPNIHQYYSGMLPGWIAGHYTKEQCRIDLRPLVQAAGAHLVHNTIASLDAGRRCATLRGGADMPYDLLSLDIGSGIETSTLEAAASRLLPAKPLDRFFEAWPSVMQAAAARKSSRLVVVGGGAAGVELALAVRHAWKRAAINGSVDLVAPELLPGHAPTVQRRAERVLAQAGIALHRQRTSSSPGTLGSADGVTLEDGTLLEADCVIAATGTRAPHWLEASALQLDAQGYIVVDHHHRSVSHPDVYAAGDVCARQDVHMARSGVHAVHAGPVLAANLLAALKGEAPLQTYMPRQHSLSLLACGDHGAIASWGNFSVEGRWVWRWKDYIDRGFIARFSYYPQ